MTSPRPCNVCHQRFNKMNAQRTLTAFCVHQAVGWSPLALGGPASFLPPSWVPKSGSTHSLLRSTSGPSSRGHENGFPSPLTRTFLNLVPGCPPRAYLCRARAALDRGAMRECEGRPGRGNGLLVPRQSEPAAGASPGDPPVCAAICTQHSPEA